MLPGFLQAGVIGCVAAGTGAHVGAALATGLAAAGASFDDHPRRAHAAPLQGSWHVALRPPACRACTDCRVARLPYFRFQRVLFEIAIAFPLPRFYDFFQLIPEQYCMQRPHFINVFVCEKLRSLPTFYIVS
jgi:hypothetical protein